MDRIRPDLSKVDPQVLAYIQALEGEIERLRERPSPTRARERREEEVESELPLVPEEPPTTIQVITLTASGLAKRTPRHLYTRQRRGGMGVFDLDSPDDNPPSILCLADESQTLLLLSEHGRAFRMPVSSIPETGVRGRGESIVAKLNLSPDEKLKAALPVQAQGYIALVGRNGMVRLLRHHVFGEYMKPGAPLIDLKTFGPLASASWTAGDGDLFIATRQGRAIRFSEKLIPPQGGLGIRLADGDSVEAITGVREDSGVFILSSDGRGTIRKMEGFNPNKAPGAGGKAAMLADDLAGAAAVEEGCDILILSRLSKVIRFQAAEVPPKDGVVQGVNCMSFRADQAVALAISYPSES